MEQIGYEGHTRWCRGHFLPLHNIEYHKFDGLYDRAVEHWSGNITIWSKIM